MFHSRTAAIAAIEYRIKHPKSNIALPRPVPNRKSTVLLHRHSRSRPAHLRCRKSLAERNIGNKALNPFWDSCCQRILTPAI